MTTCFHCGRPLRDENGHAPAVMINGRLRPMCCAGCEAAASLIIAQGLERYYDFRAPPTQAPAAPGPQHWEAFDRQAALQRYTHGRPDGTRELSLRIEGLLCSACGWLIESSLAQLPGVQLICVNAVSAQAEIRFDPRQVALSLILTRIATLGYDPRPLTWDEPVSSSNERRAALKRLAVAGFGMMTVMTYATSLYAGALQGIAPDLEQLLRLVSLVVTTPVVLYAAQPFFQGAWRGLRIGVLGMDVPVALSIAAAYGWSLICTLRGTGAVYFDSAVMFTFFLLLGRYIEMSLRAHAGVEHEALTQLLPQTTLRLQGNAIERILPSEISSGDRLRILPGERLPADGHVLSGCTEVDESLLTGESKPKPRQAGNDVIAGSVNLSGTIDIAVTRVGQESTLASIARLLGQARASRPAMSSVVDRVAAWFVGGVLVLAAITFIGWWQVSPARAFPIALAVLVVTCPCALSLATPAAFAAACTGLARDGLLLTSGRALERLRSVDCIVFDKTGTLTRGSPQIEHTQRLAGRMSRERAAAIAAALERYSEHPLARAFAEIEPATGVSDVQILPGRGIEGRVDGVRYRLGRETFLWPPEQRLAAAGTSEDTRTVVLLGDEQGPLAAFALRDTLRADAPATIRQLQARGLTTIIASGDAVAAVADIARQAGVSRWHGGMSAEAKLLLIRALQADGHRVAMIGDGINDAPVLAAADTSVAVGSGTDLAKVNAQIILLGDSTAPLVKAIDTARLTFTIIRQNLGWAIVYNGLAVPLAAFGWLEPWMAAVGMSASSLLVVLNALRLVGPRASRRRVLPDAPVCYLPAKS